MNRPEFPNRRVFLSNSIAALSALGTGVLISSDLFADRTQLALRIEETDESHPLRPALDLATQSLEALDQVKDYSATFIKSELVGRKLSHARMELKLREDPFSVYLKFLQPNAGREVIYVAGRNNNYLQVHDVGFASLAGTLSLDPNGSFAMDGNRYPVTSIGMRHLLTKLIEVWLKERQVNTMNVNIYPKAHIGEIACKAIEVTHRRPHPSVKFHSTRLYLDNEHYWPIRFQAYDFPGRRQTEPPLAEDYMYADVKANIGLTDIDFDTRNPKYRF